MELRQDQKRGWMRYECETNRRFGKPEKPPEVICIDIGIMVTTHFNDRLIIQYSELASNQFYPIYPS